MAAAECQPASIKPWSTGPGALVTLSWLLPITSVARDTCTVQAEPALSGEQMGQSSWADSGAKDEVCTGSQTAKQSRAPLTSMQT